MELIQSVLFRSPYSGCAGFSGWPRAHCEGPKVQGPSSAYSRAPAVCSDHAKRRSSPWPIVLPATLPPRATVTSSKPPYNLRPIAGPSSSGPFTTICTRGEFWGRGPVIGVGSSRGAGHNLGLT